MPGQGNPTTKGIAMTVDMTKTDSPTIRTFVVRAQLGTQDLDVQLIGTNPQAAIARTRMGLMHNQRNADWLDKATYSILADVPGTVEGEILHEAALAREDAICEICYEHSSDHDWVVVAPDTHVTRCSIQDARDIEDGL